ncbi:MAG TPA: hypothetical protein VFC73_09690 [Syntrophomonadaceae bacterium]|nr:hypothetical protein [Syntrophomonadaceae bacterium]
MERLKRIVVTSDASGARQAALDGMLVIIVDVIDMSTTLESALDAGAYAILGASPDYTRAPVSVAPDKIGIEACRLAREINNNIVIVSEPRVGSDDERIARCQKVINSIQAEGGIIEAILPNLGAETPKITELKDRVVVAVTDTGGVAYDAAYVESRQVVTATVARTYKQRGIEPALTGVRRAYKLLKETDTGIAVVAASRNSMEDVLAAQFIANLITMNKHIIHEG